MNNIENVLKFLFEEPIKEFHIRLLARLTKLNPNTIINLTDKLVEEGLIIKYKNKDNKLCVIKANTQNSYYKLKKQFYNIEKIFRSGLIDYLNENLSYPAVILFGSYTKAENHSGSDIDLFIISEEKKKLDLKIYKNKLNAEIQLFVHTKKEFNKLKNTSPELINNVLNGYKLTGYLEVFDGF